MKDPELISGSQSLPVLLADLFWRFDDLVHKTIFDGLLCIEIEISVGIAFDHLKRLAGVLGENASEQTLQAQDLLGLDLDICGLTLCAAKRLMHMNGCMRQGVAPALGAGGQQHGPE